MRSCRGRSTGGTRHSAHPPTATRNSRSSQARTTIPHKLPLCALCTVAERIKSPTPNPALSVVVGTPQPPNMLPPPAHPTRHARWATPCDVAVMWPRAVRPRRAPPHAHPMPMAAVHCHQSLVPTLARGHVAAAPPTHYPWRSRWRQQDPLLCASCARRRATVRQRAPRCARSSGAARARSA